MSPAPTPHAVPSLPVSSLKVVCLLLAAFTTLSTQSVAQGRCIRAYGTPACNTDPIKPVFERTGWRTTALSHISFKIAEPAKEAAFYTAVMGWTVRSEDAKRIVMDIGDWGTAVFKATPVDSFPTSPTRRANATPVHAIVDGFGFDIEPWNAKTVEAELRKRGLSPVADNDGKGYESFHVKDPDGFDVQIGNGKGYTAARRKAATAKLSAPLPFESTGWQTVWLDHFSFGATNYKASVSFYVNLLGWGPTYDEGSQNELMMADVGDIIIRGGNPLDPAFGQTPGRRGGAIDHISFGISPWDTDKVKAELEKRGLTCTIDTSDGAEIHVAQYKSYHTTTPNGYNLQISYNTHDTRLNLAVAVNPRRGVK
jgi:catechol 2,3-dioxygenase-like lactoylglutathione lyase family enzyme